MRAVKLMTFCLVLAMPTLAMAEPLAPVPDERALREECGEFPQAAMLDCLTQKARDGRKALRKAEQAVNEKLAAWDEDSKFVRRARAKVAKSNLEFGRYREAQCRFAAGLSGGAAGNAHELRRQACLAALDFGRAAQLRDAVSDLPLK